MASVWVWPKGNNNRVLGGERRSILGYLFPLHLYLCLARVVAVVCSIAIALVLQFLFCGPKHFLGFGNTIPILVPLDVK